MLSRCFSAALACSVLIGSAVAQPPAASILPPSPQAPTLNLPQPLGVQPGASVELTLTGTMNGTTEATKVVFSLIGYTRAVQQMNELCNNQNETGWLIVK